MPRKSQSIESQLIHHFMGAPLMVAQAQLAMLTQLVARRAEVVTEADGKAQVRRGPKPKVQPIGQPVMTPAGPTIIPPPPVRKSHKKKAPGYAAGGGPASTMPGDPGMPPERLGE